MAARFSDDTAMLVEDLLAWAAERWPPLGGPRDWTKEASGGECLSAEDILDHFGAWSRARGAAATVEAEVVDDTLQVLVALTGQSQLKAQGLPLPFHVHKQKRKEKKRANGRSVCMWRIQVNLDFKPGSGTFLAWRTKVENAERVRAAKRVRREDTSSAAQGDHGSSTVSTEEHRTAECSACRQQTSNFSKTQLSKAAAERRCATCIEAANRLRPSWNNDARNWRQSMACRSRPGDSHGSKAAQGVCDNLYLQASPTALSDALAAVQQSDSTNACVRLGLSASLPSAAPLTIEWSQPAHALVASEVRCGAPTNRPMPSEALALEVLYRLLGCSRFALVSSESELDDDADFCASVGGRAVGVDVTLAVGTFDKAAGAFVQPSADELAKKLRAKLVKAQQVATRRLWKPSLVIFAPSADVADACVESVRSLAADNATPVGVVAFVVILDSTVFRVALVGDQHGSASRG